MANTISKIKLPNNTTYDIRDAGIGEERWSAITQGQKWSRIYLASPTNVTVGTSGFLSVTCTRGSVVCNATFLITSSHAGSGYANCQEIGSNNYTAVRSRLVANSSGSYYFEIYDSANAIASGTTQTWNCCFIPLAATTLTVYTTFTDGTTVPSGYVALNDFTTTLGSSAYPIKNITRSGTTYTATRSDGSTFTFTQQDNNTTYSLTQNASDGHKITLTPSSGTAQTITIPDNNTTYTLGTSGNNVTLTPAGGTAQSITTPYATSSDTATKPKGFASQADNFTWGNQTGTAITVWNDSSGGSIGFRKDNPSSGKMSIDIDGTIYINEGKNNLGDAIKSITRSGTTFTYTTVWGDTGTFTQQDNDTKNTAGSTDTSSKIFLIGATSQAANPQTYSDNEVYATSGVLTTKSVQVGGGSCTLQYNSTTASCDFVFA